MTDDGSANTLLTSRKSIMNRISATLKDTDVMNKPRTATERGTTPFADAITDADHAFFLMDEINRSARAAFEQRIHGLGLNRTQWRIITQIARNPLVSQTELGTILELKKATIGLAISSLENAGYINRLRSPDDQRVWQIVLLPKVKTALPVLRDAADDVYKHLWGILSKEQQDFLIETLERMAARTSEL
ncbi:hypothetical protein B5C34_06555 [Pacificimonas flava]|uniref:HTH marR-type domain-containing protein n=2 Tax=Pacificimonas TaxID=1960290 RepID=A0A219B474_9SPHN|nr:MULTISPECIES: MarR family transcriptional regulator [Pacificimonas]MBZ6377115.1 MarR family transcriptional regulator [Pacificimonas aurantium]OWV33157.1 hypothetical protein B5C34_06555 [Pacificimonas flava]